VQFVKQPQNPEDLYLGVAQMAHTQATNVCLASGAPASLTNGKRISRVDSLQNKTDPHV
jgi:hypothetical protein